MAKQTVPRLICNACIHYAHEGIEKYFTCLLESHAVLGDVCSGLVYIPDEIQWAELVEHVHR